MIDIPEHETEIARLPEAEIERLLRGLRYRCIRRQKLETGGKFSGSETRLMKTLPPRSAPVKDIEMLTYIVIRSHPSGHLEVGTDDIGDIDQHGRGALLAFLLD